MYKSVEYIKNLLNNQSISSSSVIYDEFSEDYEGLLLELEGRIYRSRLAKKTPKKSGYFVAFWEKDSQGINQPYSFDNYPEKLIVTVLDGDFRGQFIIPRKVLLDKKILKGINSKGKMAMRFYPSWENSLNKTAKTTQEWQCQYFIDTSKSINTEKMNKLYFS